MSSQKALWIDLAKTGAIIGVLIQHTQQYLYTNMKIFYSVWWVVALFVVIGGYNAMVSYQKKGRYPIKEKLLRILIPYLAASIIYVFFYKNQFFIDGKELLARLVHFNAAEPFYYVAVFLWLVAITPLFIGIIRWCEQKRSLLRYICTWGGVVALCCFTTHRTNFFDIALGGGNLFAGPWLLFWFFGLFVSNLEFTHNTYFSNNLKGKKKKLLLFFVLTGLIVIWQFVFVTRGYNLTLQPIFGGDQVRMTWANTFETCLLFFWFRLFGEGIQYLAGNTKVFCLPIHLIGGKTLYIFLYHLLFLRIYKRWFEVSGVVGAVLCFCFMIVGPIIMSYIFERVKKVLRAIFLLFAARDNKV